MPKPRKTSKGHTKSCGTKQAFDTEQEAIIAARRGRYDYMRAYKCKKCGKYHYGHPPTKDIMKF